jgi:serine-type anaerobic sulfatase-maturating enzyme
MLKPRGELCNLDCTCCFCLAKQRLFPDSRFRMADDLLESYTRQNVQAQRVGAVTFAWQGGEPTLMGLDFFRRAVELQHKYRPNRLRIFNTMQTNRILLNDEWCEFLKQNDILAGLSINGPRPLHDAYRLDKAGRGTFRQVIRGLQLLKKHAVEINILTGVWGSLCVQRRMPQAGRLPGRLS